RRMDVRGHRLRRHPARRGRRRRTRPGPPTDLLRAGRQHMTANTPTGGRAHEVGVGLVSVGWMGKLHSRAYQALPSFYPDLRLRPRLVHAADTAADRVAYARDALGYAKGS